MKYHYERELFYAVTTINFPYWHGSQPAGRYSGHLRCFFLPMVFGNGGGSFTPTSEWIVAKTGAPAVPIGLVILALLLLSVLFVLVTSVTSFFQILSPRIVAWRRITAITGLIIQGPIGFAAGFLYAFGLQFGVGYWLALFGCIVMCIGTFLS